MSTGTNTPIDMAYKDVMINTLSFLDGKDIAKARSARKEWNTWIGGSADLLQKIVSAQSRALAAARLPAALREAAYIRGTALMCGEEIY